MRLLLVEDNPRLVELLRETVHRAGWRIDNVGTIADAHAAIREGDHDLMVLDLGLPDGNGLQLLKQIRAEGSPVPVLIVTAAGDVDARVAGLDAGADDYLAKPFNHREFLARCRAVARRSGSGAAAVLAAGNLRYDPAQASLSLDGEAIALPPRERQLAEILMREVDRVVSKRRLESALSEYGDDLSTNALELAISRLRKKIELPSSGARIETVRGVGYLLRTLLP